jgi:hypothetical protein
VIADVSLNMVLLVFVLMVGVVFSALTISDYFLGRARRKQEEAKRRIEGEQAAAILEARWRQHGPWKCPRCHTPAASGHICDDLLQPPERPEIPQGEAY